MYILYYLYIYIPFKSKHTLVSCCLGHFVKSAPVVATDLEVRVKSTVITSSQPVNVFFKIFVYCFCMYSFVTFPIEKKR